MTSDVPGRILVAVDDSPAGLEAARLATTVAAGSKARLRLVHVISDGNLARALRKPQAAESPQHGQAEDAQALLRRLRTLAQHAGVEAEIEEVHGDPAPCLLDEARRWHADLVVIGRSDIRRPGSPYVGSVTRHILEFSECPVLITVGTTHGQHQRLA